MNKIVVFDLDGVLRDFEGAVVEHLYIQHGNTAYRRRDLYSFYERYADYPETLRSALDFVANPVSYKNVDPIQPMIDFAIEAAEGFEVLFLSSCPLEAYRISVFWLREHGLNVSNYQVYCGVKNKAEWLLSYGQEVEFVVEDSPENIKNLQAAGFRVYCWSQPWNEGVFPRLEVNNKGELMVWATESTESFPFSDLYVEAE